MDTTLWHGSGGSVSTGAGGLTLTPSSLSAPGHSDAGLEANLPVYTGDPFAFMVPFSITGANANLPGVVDLNIDICGVGEHAQCDSTAWGMAND